MGGHGLVSEDPGVWLVSLTGRGLDLGAGEHLGSCGTGSGPQPAFRIFRPQKSHNGTPQMPVRMNLIYRQLLKALKRQLYSFCQERFIIKTDS